MDRSLLDKNVHDIDFKSLDPIKELRKINPKFMETFDKMKGNNRVHWLKAYNVGCPVEEALVQFALDEIMPIKLSQTEESRVRREMAEEASKGIEISSPEEEAEWEEKLQAAMVKDKENLEKIKADRAGQYSGGKGEGNGSSGDGLSDVKGLGGKSIEKLHAAGIKTADEFNALTEEQLKVLVGPLVASKFNK